MAHERKDCADPALGRIVSPAIETRDLSDRSHQHMRHLKFCIVAAMLALTVQAHAQGGRFILDYKGMLFGREMTDPRSLKKDHQQGEMTFYTRYGNDRVFQGVPLEEEYLGYAKDKLCLVLFRARGPNAYNAFKAYFDANYGPARQPKMNVKQFIYGAGDVDIQFNYDDNRKQAEVSYIYRPIFKQLMPGG